MSEWPNKYLKIQNLGLIPYFYSQIIIKHQNFLLNPSQIGFWCFVVWLWKIQAGKFLSLAGCTICSHLRGSEDKSLQPAGRRFSRKPKNKFDSVTNIQDLEPKRFNWERAQNKSVVAKSQNNATIRKCLCGCGCVSLTPQPYMQKTVHGSLFILQSSDWYNTIIFTEITNCKYSTLM